MDTSAFLALVDASDQYHTQASAIMDRLADQQYRLFTTNVLIIESHARILSAIGADQARRFLASFEESRINIVRV